MSFGFSGSLDGDIAGGHVDALATYAQDGAEQHVAAAKDAVKLLLSRVWQDHKIGVNTTGHLNTDGTGYVSITITAAAPPEAPAVAQDAGKVVELYANGAAPHILNPEDAHLDEPKVA